MQCFPFRYRRCFGLGAALLLLASCAVKGPAGQARLATDIQAQPLLSGAAMFPQRTDPVLLGLNTEDLNLTAAKARLKYTPYWHVVSERACFVRHRILKVLQQLHAPTSLQVVPVVESTYDPYALSYSGAMGLWQLMPRTAKGLGIQADAAVNGRRHVETSTRAAVTYLQQLHDRFNSWPLAFAAYHMGPNALARLLAKHPWQHGDGLQAMPVPQVTREYVQNIIGLTVLLDRGEFAFDDPIRTVPVTLHPPVSLALAQQQMGKTNNELFRLNPGLNRAEYHHTDITIHVPEQEVADWQNLPPYQGPSYARVQVKSGDSLWKIARRHHVSLVELKRINHLSGHMLHIGQTLKVPSSSGATLVAGINPLLSNGNRLRYSVRKGDSLWKIARRFGTTPAAIAKINHMSLNSHIYPGDKIWVHAHPREG